MSDKPSNDPSKRFKGSGKGDDKPSKKQKGLGTFGFTLKVKHKSQTLEAVVKKDAPNEHMVECAGCLFLLLLRKMTSNDDENDEPPRNARGDGQTFHRHARNGALPATLNPL